MQFSPVLFVSGGSSTKRPAVYLDTSSPNSTTSGGIPSKVTTYVFIEQVLIFFSILYFFLGEITQSNDNTVNCMLFWKKKPTYFFWLNCFVFFLGRKMLIAVLVRFLVVRKIVSCHSVSYAILSILSTSIIFHPFTFHHTTCFHFAVAVDTRRLNDLPRLVPISLSPSLFINKSIFGVAALIPTRI